ncbi:hypothetical protein [Kitasatospora aureofaciens]|uniref:hypothetical protein n=1 Tax=Kitasatospora aureofaciens TaxID=1894 RepID=UPI0036F46BBB
MRANHATEPQQPAPRGGAGARRAVAGARRAVARWLRRPRSVAACGALLAQLWAVGAPSAYAAPAEPPSRQPGPAVSRTLHDAPALDGPSAVRPVEQGRRGTAGDGRSPGLVGERADGGPADRADAAVGDVLQERIRAGGLPLPGQGAAVPDAFALASGLLGTAPAEGRSAGTRASREGEPGTLPATSRPRSGSADQGRPAPSETAGTTAVRDAAADEGPASAEPADTAGNTQEAMAPGTPAAAPAGAGTPEALALADTASTASTASATAATAGADDATTATTVLAPIAAGLLLTGAAMCKHRGLPRGH